jgi:hypothetical protein
MTISDPEDGDRYIYIYILSIGGDDHFGPGGRRPRPAPVHSQVERGRGKGRGKEGRREGGMERVGGNGRGEGGREVGDRERKTERQTDEGKRETRDTDRKTDAQSGRGAGTDRCQVDRDGASLAQSRAAKAAYALEPLCSSSSSLGSSRGPRLTFAPAPMEKGGKGGEETRDTDRQVDTDGDSLLSRSWAPRRSSPRPPPPHLFARAAPVPPVLSYTATGPGGRWPRIRTLPPSTPRPLPVTRAVPRLLCVACVCVRACVFVCARACIFVNPLYRCHAGAPPLSTPRPLWAIRASCVRGALACLDLCSNKGGCVQTSPNKGIQTRCRPPLV